MTIQKIVKAGKGRAGSGGAWRVEKTYTGITYTLWHYDTRMLVWSVDVDGTVDVIEYSTGNGSVSDQNGMNKAFRVLGSSLYFSRKGGAEIR